MLKSSWQELYNCKESHGELQKRLQSHTYCSYYLYFLFIELENTVSILTTH